MSEKRNNLIVCASLIVGLAVGVGVGLGLPRFFSPARLLASTQSSHQHDGDDHHSHEGVCQQDHDDPCEQDDHEIRMSAEAAEQAGIKIATATGGELELTVNLPGEIVLNSDRVAHIVPRVSGTVRSVEKNAGDLVQKGDLLATIESRELAENKAAALAASERLSLSQRSIERREALWAQKLVSEQEYLESQRQLSEAQINARTMAAKLHAIGVTKEQFQNLSHEPDATLSLYEIRAPFAGTIIQKHLAIGEYVSADHDVFAVADLSTVWANITVFAKDASRIKEGNAARVVGQGNDLKERGTIFYVSPIIDEATRTTSARVSLPNEKRLWKPGLFVHAAVITEKKPVKLLVRESALQSVEGFSTLFVSTEHGFSARRVVTGQSDGVSTEILSGLDPDDKYVAEGGFVLKADLGKGEAEHEH